MLVCLNGNLVPANEAKVSVFDRGFLYGDALFETMCVSNHRIFRWDQHWERLRNSAELLELRLPWSNSFLRRHALELIQKNVLDEGVLRLTVSRGSGPRGYSHLGADEPFFILSFHPPATFPDQGPRTWKTITSKWRLPAGEGLHSLKTANRLIQVMARSEAARNEADEALLLNANGILTEGAASNVFWIEDEKVFTPPCSTGLLHGVTRAVLLEICANLQIPACELEAPPERLQRACGIFCTLSTWGVVEVAEWNGRPCGRSLLVPRLQAAYASILRKETSESAS